MLERILFDPQLMQDKDWLMMITMLLMKLEKRYCCFILTTMLSLMETGQKSGIMKYMT